MWYVYIEQFEKVCFTIETIWKMAEYEIKNDDILDSLGEGVFTVDKSFRINFFNKAAEKITGHKKEDVVGKFCKNIFKSN